MSALSGYAQPSSTKVTAEQRLKEVIQIINSYDVRKAGEYIQQNYAPDFLRTTPFIEQRALLARINDECKVLHVNSLSSQGKDGANALVRLGLTGAWRQFIVQIEPSSPGRITQVLMKLAAPPPGDTSNEKPKSIKVACDRLDMFARKLEKENIFSGNILVAKHGKVIFYKAYGLASKEFKYPNTLSTKFIIGSINKMFTATAIMQLIEQNKLALDDLVSNVLPGVLSEEIARKIKIRHLLTHTSGLGDFLFTPEMNQKSRENFRTIADYLPLLKDDTLFFEPGSQWSYSNTGYLLLGAIVEKLSGMPYEDFIARNIYKPSGMNSSYFPELDNVNVGLADTYEKDYLSGQPVFHNTRYYQVIKGTPAGGGFSTCPDLLNFMQALNQEKLLKPASVKAMQSAKPEMNSPDYGFGMQIFDESSFGHTGGGPGTSAVVRTDVKKGLTIIILCNQNNGSSILERKVFELF